MLRRSIDDERTKLEAERKTTEKETQRLLERVHLIERERDTMADEANSASAECVTLRSQLRTCQAELRDTEEARSHSARQEVLLKHQLRELSEEVFPC